MARYTLTLTERFMQYVEPEPNSGCWLWTGSTVHNGYGTLRIGSRTDGTRHSVQTHRLSYGLFVGSVPDGIFVLHRCDVRSCVNPDHLFLGTRQENMSDMARKGRGRVSKGGLPYGVAFKSWLRSRPFEAFVKFRGQDCRLGTFATAEQAHSVAVEFKRVAPLTGSPDKARKSVAALLAGAKVHSNLAAQVDAT